MPHYDYACLGCKSRVTRLVPIAERDKQFCEKCDTFMLRQQAAPSFAFKGPGFYATDYRKKESE